MGSDLKIQIGGIRIQYGYVGPDLRVHIDWFESSGMLVRIQSFNIRSDKGVDRYDCKSVKCDTSWSRPRVFCFQGSVCMIRFVSSV